jgi:hypothetical protein
MIIVKVPFLVSAIVLTNLAAPVPANATSLVVDSEQDKNKSELLTVSTTSYELGNKLLQEAKNTINELNEASQVTQVIVEDREVYMYRFSSANPSATNASETNTSVPTYAVYTNRWLSPVISQRKKVPESSSLLSLIAFTGLFIKINQHVNKGFNPSFKVFIIRR